MPVRDNFDSTWKLPVPDDSVAGAYEQPKASPSDSQRPSVIQFKGDGTAQLRSAANTKHNSAVPSGGGGQSESISDKFGGLSATPPSDRGLKHGKWDHSDR